MHTSDPLIHRSILRQNSSFLHAMPDRSPSPYRVIRTVCLLVIWTVLCISQATQDKRLLRQFPHPYVLATVKLGVASLCSVSLWATRIRPLPKNTTHLKALLPLALLNAVGLVLSYVALQKGTASVTHIVRAAQPAVSTLLLLSHTHKKSPSQWTLLWCIPMLVGVLYACHKTINLSWMSCWAAAGANVAFAVRGILSNRLTHSSLHRLGAANLFGVLTVISFLLALPICAYMEGRSLWLDFKVASVEDDKYALLIQQLWMAGLGYYLSVEATYWALDSVKTAVAHSAGDMFRRLVMFVVCSTLLHEEITDGTALGYLVTEMSHVMQVYVRAREHPRQPRMSPKRHGVKIMESPR